MQSFNIRKILKDQLDFFQFDNQPHILIYFN